MLPTFAPGKAGLTNNPGVAIKFGIALFYEEEE